MCISIATAFPSRAEAMKTNPSFQLNCAIKLIARINKHSHIPTCVYFPDCKFQNTIGIFACLCIRTYTMVRPNNSFCIQFFSRISNLSLPVIRIR